jgi:hypothetical protein
VVHKNFIVSKLAGDDPPTTAENLKFLFRFDAETDSEAFDGSVLGFSTSGIGILTSFVA